ncbi:hypothetical protein DYQ86_12790 [Acidobacteria bacterium AB60]|nr:hypothetical protein DYQ86_12790 [Acidobacteria bacterium AB60]
MTDHPMGRAERLIVLASCAAASLGAIAWSWTRHAMLNYGDAVAHLHIARRVLDSHFPGYSQLGSVWLPLPHLLMIPFVAVYAWWANGVAGLIPSALAWLASCYGLYRLARRWLPPAPAAIALAFFALNPNLLYLQTTAMTEPLFVCEMVWTALWLVEWRASIDTPDENKTARLVWLIALVLVAAVFTRYDGWIMALLAWTAMGIVLLRRRRLASPAFWLASAVVVAAPVLWFAYNAHVFGDWLSFARGPYSAAAIEKRTASPGDGPPHPGWHDPWVSLLFFVKAAEMAAATLDWGNKLLLLSALGVLWGVLIARGRGFLWTLLLWLPVPFYAYSVAFGSVPIFLPVWWPHSYYNTRYGLELLPAFALGVGFAAAFVLAALREFKPQAVRAAAGILFGVVLLNALQMLRERPVVYVEGTKNIESRRAFEEQIPPVLRAVMATHPGGQLLMNTSVYPQIVAFSGIPLRQTINEGDQVLYTQALAAPAAHAAAVLAFDGDPVDQAVKTHPEGLHAVRRFTSATQPAGTLYVSDTSLGQPPGGAPAR